METLESRERKARKQHTCDFCGGTIKKGETYDWSKNINDGDLYEWKSHKQCSTISSELWAYIDPDEGMTGDDFHYGCNDFCRIFVCPDCKFYDEDEGCKEDKPFCVDRIYAFLQKNELYREKRNGYYETWKCSPKIINERNGSL